MKIIKPILTTLAGVLSYFATLPLFARLMNGDLRCMFLSFFVMLGVMFTLIYITEGKKNV
jgi:hypothetical protein